MYCTQEGRPALVVEGDDHAGVWQLGRVQLALAARKIREDIKGTDVSFTCRTCPELMSNEDSTVMSGKTPAERCENTDGFDNWLFVQLHVMI